MVVNSRLSLIFVLFLFLSLTQGEIKFENFFYWRDFNGSIPDDAVPGGDTAAGDRTFIGTTLFMPYGLIPSTIYPNDRHAYGVVAALEKKSDKFIKILCAVPDSQPIWKSVDINNLPSNCYFIEGGAELDTPLYIGRANIKGVNYLGKVFPPKSVYKGLQVFTGRHVNGIQNFEILAYCTVQRLPYNIDVRNIEQISG